VGANLIESTSSQKRVVHLKDLQLSDVLKKINPYVLRSTQVFTAEQIVKYLLYAYLSSNKIVLRKHKNFLEVYSRIVNIFTQQFVEEFCSPDGKIDWNKLAHFNSGN